MSSVTLRVLAVIATVLGIGTGASRASAQPGPHVMRPLCTGDLAVRVAPPAGDDGRVTVLVSRSAGAPCVIANFPQPAIASGAARPAALPAGRLSVAQNATIGGGAMAAFAIRYTTAPAQAASPEPAPADGTCALAVMIGPAVAKGTLPLPIPCSSLTAVAVSSYAAGTVAPDDPAATPGATTLACRPQDLDLRDVGPDPAAGALRERYALQNVGLAPCRLIGSVYAVLRDAKGTPIPLKVGVRSMIATVLVLPRGHDASFTLAYPGSGGPNGEQRCVAAATIAVTIAGTATPLVASTHVVPCPPATGPGLRISNPQPGVPLRAP